VVFEIKQVLIVAGKVNIFIQENFAIFDYEI
jgi:hypothetical protein